MDTVRVTVNGEDVGPVEQLAPVVDLGSHLTSGFNTIEVEVATTLINRLREVYPDIYGGVGRQDYGLIGPVRLIPYGQAEL